MNDDTNEKLIDIAERVLRFARNVLVVKLRFMDMAISALRVEPSDMTETICTNGEFIYYSPRFVLRNYKKYAEYPARQYLHIIFHSVFRHFFVNTFVDKRKWNIACDIAAENVLLELDIDSVKLPDDDKRIAIIEDLKRKTKHFNAEYIYRYLLDNDIKLDSIEKLFEQDDHSIWYERDKNTGGNGRGNDEDNKRNNEKDNGGNEGGDDKNTNENETDEENRSTQMQLERQWRDISEKMQLDLEGFSKQQGEKSGSLMQNLMEVNREKYDYTAFLKKFAVYGEAMKINLDEFDYIFYTYGLKLYKKMPLIEPLE